MLEHPPPLPVTVQPLEREREGGREGWREREGGRKGGREGGERKWGDSKFT